MSSPNMVAAAMAAAAGVPVVALNGGSAIYSDSAGGTVSITFNADGTVDTFTTSAGVVQIHTGTDWIIPNDAEDDHEIRFTLDSGDTPSGAAMSTWLTLGSNQIFSFTIGTSDFKACSVTVEIRNSDDVVVATKSGYVLDITSI